MENQPIALHATFPQGIDMEPLWKTTVERMDAFRAFAGLRQKVYMYDPEHRQPQGFYIFENTDALDAYLASDLFRSIRSAFQLDEPPAFRRLDVVGTLYPLGGKAVASRK